MKRSLCLLLILTVLLCACKGASPVLPPTDPSGEETSEASSGAEKAPFVESETVEKIRSFQTQTVPDRSMKAKNILASYPYSFSEEPNESYPDPNRKKLSDGVKRELFDKYNWVGFRPTGTVYVEYDLGEGGMTFADWEVDCLQQTDYGIYFPVTVSLLVSDDGEDFTQIGCIRTPNGLGISEKYVYRFAFSQEIRARYVRVSMYKGGAFLFLDEISAYHYCKDGNIDVASGEAESENELDFDFYRYALNTTPSAAADPSEADYDVTQNLARLPGVDVQAMHFDPMDANMRSANSKKTDLKKLIDGAKAVLADHSDGAFVRFYRACGRHIVIDLGAERAVGSVRMEFLNQVNSGVGTPPAVMISASDGGNDWVTVGAKYTGVYGKPETEVITVDIPMENAVRARYLRISFLTVPDNDISCFCLLSEIEVFGKKNLSGAILPQASDAIRYGRYPNAEECGCENIFFAAIHGQKGENGALFLDPESAMLTLAHLDGEGNCTDGFMDSFCFSPDNKFVRAEDAKVSADRYLNDCFTPETNLHALSSAYAEAKKSLPQLNAPTVWFSFICPRSGESCSDVDGDGIAEDLRTVDGRFAFLKYQVDTAVARFRNECGDLTLLGFYWNDECMFEYERDINEPALRRINDYLHSLGLRAFWCPYYNAFGYWMWEELGFDFAVLQPNYMFGATESTRLTSAADTAKIMGMGVELEIEDWQSEGAVGLYRAYLREGIDSGYMHGVKLYYQGAANGAIAGSYRSNAEFSRSVYEDTYRYAKGLLDERYNKPQSVSTEHLEDICETVTNGRSITVQLGDLTGLRTRFLETPLFGSVRLDPNGTMVYSAMKGYAGDEFITVEVYDDTGNRKTVTVLILVTE